MATTVRNILQAFESLPENEKHELASEIIRRSNELNLPPLSDEDFVMNAEELFSDLDRRESQVGESN